MAAAASEDSLMMLEMIEAKGKNQIESKSDVVDEGSIAAPDTGETAELNHDFLTQQVSALNGFMQSVAASLQSIQESQETLKQKIEDFEFNIQNENNKRRKINNGNIVVVDQQNLQQTARHQKQQQLKIQDFPISVPENDQSEETSDSVQLIENPSQQLCRQVLIAVGGSLTRNKRTSLSTCLLYDPMKNVWLQFPALSHSRAGASCILHSDGYLYAFGGHIPKPKSQALHSYITVERIYLGSQNSGPPAGATAADSTPPPSKAWQSAAPLPHMLGTFPFLTAVSLANQIYVCTSSFHIGLYDPAKGVVKFHVINSNATEKLKSSKMKGRTSGYYIGITSMPGPVAAAGPAAGPAAGHGPAGGTTAGGAGYFYSLDPAINNGTKTDEKANRRFDTSHKTFSKVSIMGDKPVERWSGYQLVTDCKRGCIYAVGGGDGGGGRVGRGRSLYHEPQSVDRFTLKMNPDILHCTNLDRRERKKSRYRPGGALLEADGDEIPHDRLYLAGGSGSSTVEFFNLETHRWTQVASLPNPRQNFSLVPAKLPVAYLASLPLAFFD